MRKAKVIPKRGPGRPATGKNPLVAVRLPPMLIKALDTWSTQNRMTRSAAIRHLIELGVTAAPPMKQRIPDAAAKARAYAAADQRTERISMDASSEVEELKCSEPMAIDPVVLKMKLRKVPFLIKTISRPRSLGGT